MKKTHYYKIIFFFLVFSFTGVHNYQNISRGLASKTSLQCRESLATFLRSAEYTHKRDSSFHQRPRLLRILNHLKDLNKPKEKIAYYFLQLEKQFKKVKNSSRYSERLKKFLHQKYIIASDQVPESYFDRQRTIMRNQGHGDVPITDAMREEAITVLQIDQKDSLDEWLDYFFTDDADVYPTWLKMWSFEEMLKLGNFNSEAGKFAKRTADTVAPYAELNREAYGIVIDAISKKSNGERIDDLTNDHLKELLNSGASFGKLYGEVLKELKNIKQGGLSETQGVWVKYKQGSNASELAQSLKGKATGWCTAGESTAQSQLNQGDFYVFYTKDQVGNNTNPRFAIRMEGQIIGEIRGVASDQNLDEVIAKTSILDNKLSEFGDEGKRYQENSNDMRVLTDIADKHQQNIDLSVDELKFLYEIDKKITGFGYSKDPRIGEIVSTRNIRKDLVQITGFKESEISITKEEALSGGIKYHYGNLDIVTLYTDEKMILPEIVNGNIYFNSLSSAENLTLPKVINGDLHLGALKRAKGLVLPKNIGGYLHLGWLESPKDLILPEVLEGSLNLGSLKNAKGLKLPRNIPGHLILGSLTNTKGLVFPDDVYGDLILSNLKKIGVLTLPARVGGTVDLTSLISGNYLKLPEVSEEDISLWSLKRIDNLIVPNKLGGKLDVSSLPSKQRAEILERLKTNLILL